MSKHASLLRKGAKLLVRVWRIVGYTYWDARTAFYNRRDYECEKLQRFWNDVWWEVEREEIEGQKDTTDANAT